MAETNKPVPGRNIALACEHPEGLATLHRDEATAWCPVCEADVEVAKTREAAEAARPTGFTHFPPQSGMDDRSAEDNGLIG